MIDRPTEQEQIDIIIKNLRPVYQTQLQTQYLPSFKSLVATANKVEDLIRTGQLKVESSGSRYKKPGNQNIGKTNEVANITPVNPLRVGNASAGNNKPRRQYTNLGVPIVSVFHQAMKSNYIQPMEAKPLPNPLPRNFKVNEYCEFHQGNGHKTEACWTLRNRIKDLVDQGLIIPKNRPNITTNPLPNHGVNTIILEVESFDPFKLFLEMNGIATLDLNVARRMLPGFELFRDVLQTEEQGIKENRSEEGTMPEDYMQPDLFEEVAMLSAAKNCRDWTGLIKPA